MHFFVAFAALINLLNFVFNGSIFSFFLVILLTLVLVEICKPVKE